MRDNCCILKLKLLFVVQVFSIWFKSTRFHRGFQTFFDRVFLTCPTFTHNQNAASRASTCAHLIRALQQMACDYILDTPATFRPLVALMAVQSGAEKTTNNKVVVESGASSAQKKKKKSNSTACQRLPSITRTHTEVQISIIYPPDSDILTEASWAPAVASPAPHRCRARCRLFWQKPLKSKPCAAPALLLLLWLLCFYFLSLLPAHMLTWLPQCREQLGPRHKANTDDLASRRGENHITHLHLNVYIPLCLCGLVKTKVGIYELRPGHQRPHKANEDDNCTRVLLCHDGHCDSMCCSGESFKWYQSLSQFMSRSCCCL